MSLNLGVGYVKVSIIIQSLIKSSGFTINSISKQSLQYWAEQSNSYYLAKHQQHRYVSFDADIGGLNNIRLGFEYAVVIAAITGRTLVLPPARPWYLINFGPMADGEPGGETHLGDIFDLPALSQAIPIMSAEAFIEQASKHLDIPEEFDKEACKSENKKLSHMHQRWSDWLSANSTIVPWNPYDTLVCVPSVAAVQNATELDEHYVDGRNLVEFSPWMNAAPLIHLSLIHI